MVPFLYLAIKSLYWSKGATLSKFMWCSEESIKPYFIKAGKNLRYKNLYRQMMDSLEDKEFPKLSQEVKEPFSLSLEVSRNIINIMML